MGMRKVGLYPLSTAIILLSVNIAHSLTVAGIEFSENAFADTVISTNAVSSHFVTGDPQTIVSPAIAITGSSQETYFDPGSGEYVELGFTDNVLRNGVGDDFAVFELGTAEIAAIRLTVGGVQKNVQSTFTGFSNLWGASINVAFFDLDDFGVPPNGTIQSLVLATVGAPEFSAVGAIPEPSTALLFGLGLIGFAVRERRV